MTPRCHLPPERIHFLTSSASSGVSRAEIDQVLALSAGTIGFPATVAVYSWVRDQLGESGAPAHSPKLAATSAGSSAGATSGWAVIIRAQLFHRRIGSSLAGGRTASARSKWAIACRRHW